ncbi:putative Fe-S oxidoreductase [Burkholderiales bacterium JOSHI_001]|nr:putative Fe-S oxidoreductase [Burkholderiales bacterium JOSHI_001]
MNPEPNPEPTAIPGAADLEEGLRFLHTLGMQSKMDLVAANTRLLALVEELVASGTLDLQAFDERRRKVSEREAARMTREAHVKVLVDETEDKYALADLPQIDCVARLPLCRARCCALSFALSFQDLNERVVQWDYGRPYHIRQRADGYCVHNQAGGCQCTVYEHRPAVCRQYDCRQDSRIWKDFDARVPADPASQDPPTP